MPVYTGTNNNDTITGSRRNDTISGLAGNDILDGGRGRDIVDGGTGNDVIKAGYDWGQGDVYIGGEGDDTYVIDGTEVDHFAFDVNLVTGTDRYHNTYDGIENIVGGKKRDELTGDNNHNVFDGRGGDDVMSGGGGNDSLSGDKGDDVIVGGTANEEMMAAFAVANTGVRAEIGDVLVDSDGESDSTSKSISNSDGANSGREDVRSAEADKIGGGEGDDLLLGMRGDDYVAGGKGDDVLYGNSDNDTLIGGEGDDTIYGGKDDDHITGGEGDDTILGDSGNDTIIAGEKGNDSYTGGSGVDTLDYSRSGADGLKIDMSKGTVKGSGHDDKINGIENLVASTGDDTIKGSKRDESIDGGAGDDVIRGYKGADTLTGGEGDDRFTWERKDVDGIDTITDFDFGSDTLDFRNLVKATKYDDLSEVVQIENTDEGTLVSVYSGSDYGWQDVVMLEDADVSLDTLAGDDNMLV
ncbi:MAG: calcium-binding protein [Hyphomicrobiaceae bacterium]